MLEVLVVEPTHILRETLAQAFLDFQDMIKTVRMQALFPATAGEAKQLLSDGHSPTDLVVDTDVVPFEWYADALERITQVRTYAFAERDALAFHRHAKTLNLPYQFVLKSHFRTLPYMIALDKNHC